MKLQTVFSFLLDLRFPIGIVIIPTLREVFADPTLLFKPASLSDIIMMHLWAVFGDGLDEGHKDTKQRLIRNNAFGVVLDLGAGYGHTANHLDRTKVTKYIALEPNTLMHAEIRKRATAAGFLESDGTLQILSFGAEHTDLICATVTGDSQLPAADTIVSFLTLCSVPRPETTILGLMEKVLKPGGKMVFFEHVRNEREDVAWWQGVWNPVWGMVFGGCRLDRRTDAWVDEWAGWAEKNLRRQDDVDEEEEKQRLLPHRVGVYVKAKVE